MLIMYFYMLLLSVFSATSPEGYSGHVCPADLAEVFPPPEDAKQVQIQSAVGLLGSEETMAFLVEREYMDGSIIDAFEARFQELDWEKCEYFGWQQFVDATQDQPVATAFSRRSFYSENCYMELSIQQPKPAGTRSGTTSKQMVMFLVREVERGARDSCEK